MRLSTPAAALAAVVGLCAAAPAQLIQNLQYLGEKTFPTDTMFENTKVGGLSGIAYDAPNGRYLAIADDRSQINPARFYSLTIGQPNGGTFDVGFTGVTTLLGGDGLPFPSGSIDPEGIALTGAGDLFISSEGDVNNKIAPFVNRFGIGGQQSDALGIPDKFLSGGNPGEKGIRNNLAFESLTLSPSGASLFTATENALFQDGDPATLLGGSPSRILRYDAQTGLPAGEFLYTTDAVIDQPIPPDGFVTNGLVELLAIDDTHLLALERSFSTGVGNNIRLFEISLDGATDISAIDSLLDVDPNDITGVERTLLLDFNSLGITLDNIEGMAFGPENQDGSRALVFVSDNNFSDVQFTQFLQFSVDVVPAPGSAAVLALGGLLAARRRR